MMNSKTPLWLALLCLAMYSCQPGETAQTLQANAQFASFVPDEFANYWYQGKAELNSYELDIRRYGERRIGDAILIFVTEDFSKEKQVKLDYPGRAGSDKISVLKLNGIWKFKTGIYDYSMMQSVFTPVELEQYPKALKSTCTSQDWCGHTFTQFNLEGDDYRFREFSYFEGEGDQDYRVKDALLEDDLWNRIRINPSSIPTGEVDLIPGAFFSRLRHEAVKAKKARVSFQEAEESSVLVVEYLHLNRTIKIQFKREFPHQVLSWETQDESGTTTRAKLREQIRSPYWQMNSDQFLSYRDTLRLGN